MKRFSATGFDQACWERTGAALTVYVLTGPSEKKLASSVRNGTAKYSKVKSKTECV